MQNGPLEWGTLSNGKHYAKGIIAGLRRLVVHEDLQVLRHYVEEEQRWQTAHPERYADGGPFGGRLIIPRFDDDLSVGDVVTDIDGETPVYVVEEIHDDRVIYRKIELAIRPRRAGH